MQQMNRNWSTVKREIQENEQKLKDAEKELEDALKRALPMARKKYERR